LLKGNLRDGPPISNCGYHGVNADIFNHLF
jgi:hypothetical protein